jgi:very-short-patch-repair endonuclease
VVDSRFDLSPDPEVARVASEQNAAITWRQLRAAGLTPAVIRTRVRRAQLFHVFYGVYSTADPSLLPLVRPTAALLSTGHGAVISGRSAAAVYGLTDPDPDVIDVTVIGRKVRPRRGMTIHRLTALAPADIAKKDNLTLTSPARTLIDFAQHAADDELSNAFGEARAKRLVSDASLKAALARAPRNHPGAARIRRWIEEDPGRTHERSKAERLMRQHLQAAQLPQPLANVKLHGYLADFVWPELKLIVEVDGYGTHGDRLAFERDRRRDQIHTAAGYVVIRVSWRQLRDEPMAVVTRIAQAIAHRAA